MKRLALALLLVPALASAQESDDPTPVESGRQRQIKYREREELDFERGLELEGELLRPGVGSVQDWKRPVFNPLIRLRTEWTTELVQSVSEVR